ncbi:MAG: Dyp-type peroxidase [Candidatus Rokubacteria bacterium]|nr:Dyp-type peroxidase [Candidatus Rokubacteria bacterium]
MDQTIRLDRIQGNVVPGFGARHQAFLWLRFPDTRAARQWLGEVLPDVTSAGQVLAFKARRRGAGYEGGAPGGPRVTWANVAFTRPGLEILGAPDIEAFSTAFKEGLAARAEERLADRDPRRWLAGGRDASGHALLILAGSERDDLEAAIAVQRERLARYGVSDLLAQRLGGGTCRGETLPHRRWRQEHFGFRDGVSQPALDGTDGTRPGDFILGYQDGDGGMTGQGPDWAREGSYLVFRRLRQDVFGFRQALHAAAEAAGLTPEQLGAKLVGRWKSGARLGERLEGWDPGFPAREAEARYAEEFAMDPEGERIPRFAHVRKAYPRDIKGAGRHRLLRRGIPYGVPLDPDATADDGVDRGLLFVSYQADIETQFEHIQRRLNDRDFPGPAVGRDPLAGQPPNPHALELPEPGGKTSVLVHFGSHVAMTGGGYFFAPSIPALAYLRDPTTAWEERQAVMADDRYRLGSFILDQNPYPWPITLPPAFDEAGSPHVFKAGLGKHVDQKSPFRVVDLAPDDPRYMQGLFWSLGGERAYRMSKAVRIEYDYTYPDGSTKTYSIIVGYEGGGGM